ncbi:hypothetical protein JXB12_07625 [candidate division KSB1 bacterium]|nr:hypothetical protein [candidate division KSB1 bacterium]
MNQYLPKLFTGVLTLICIHISHAQSINIPLDHWAYDYIERLETLGLYRGLLTKSYPLTRSDMAHFLAHIDSTATDHLSDADLNVFEQLKGEFHQELSRLGVTSKTRYHERHLLTWEQGDNSINVDGEFEQLLDVKRGDQYSETERTSFTTLGGIVRGQFGDHFNFYIRARNSLEQGTDLIEETFDPRYGTPKTISGGNVYSDEAWAYMTYQRDWFQMEFGRDRIKWGPGKRGSLMLSKENPLFEILKLSFTFDKFRFISFHGSLHSGAATKYMAGHRLEFKVFPWLFVSGSETVIYGNRDIEPSYLNPLMPYHVAEHHLGDRDNNTMGFDMTIYPLSHHKIYGELFLDDFTTAENPFTYYGNKFAFLIGHQWADPLGLSDLNLSWEYARIEPYVYTHKDSVNTYQNYNQSIGHWLGPNSDDLFIILDYRINRDIRMALITERTRHGEGDLNRPHTSGDSRKKKFLSGTVENTWSYGVHISDQVFRDVFVSLNYYFLRTDNLNRIAGDSSKDNNVSIELKMNW